MTLCGVVEVTKRVLLVIWSCSGYATDTSNIVQGKKE